MKILIDNGHGCNTPGKCSPDKRLREYFYTREITTKVVYELQARGYDAIKLVPEVHDVSLTERCRRANAFCSIYGSDNVLLISIHCNAAGDGKQWLSARGWTGWVAPNASAKSKMLASLLYNEASLYNLQGNRCVPPEKYWVGDFAIIRKTKCPAVLTENLFQDNKEDVAFLLSETGKETITKIHVDGIIKYLNRIK